MRRVIYYRNNYILEERRLEKVEVGEAVFHQFGVGCEETDQGFVNYSTAIIEKPDGTIENIYVEMIRFIS